MLSQRGSGDLRSVLTTVNRTRIDTYRGLSDEQRDPVAKELLLAFANTPDKEAGSIASTARSSLALWMDERVARATSSDGKQLDVDRFLEDGATLYLVAPAEEAIRLRPLFSALIQTVLRKATARARDQGGVLQPRLLFALDEVANFAQIPRLATHVSTGPGQGINWMLCFHDLAQLEQGYGEEQARTVWNNCRAHLLLPGQSDLKTLEQFSRAIGDETRSFRLESSRGSSSEQRIGKPLASIDSLRRLTQPVLVYANAPPARLQARRWDQVPAWRALVETRRA
jgi:type IV secretory pathway TraG/TraD family ATPase VirD4